MVKNKTTENDLSVTGFINAIADETKRGDCFKITGIMQQHTALPPKMWGTAIVGFGSVHYKYESRREGDMPIIAFSPRKAAITVYYSSSMPGKDDLFAKLGKYKTEGGCIYIKKLADVDVEVLGEIIKRSVAYVKSNNVF
jgi:hypothetical protein